MFLVTQSYTTPLVTRCPGRVTCTRSELRYAVRPSTKNSDMISMNMLFTNQNSTTIGPKEPLSSMIRMHFMIPITERMIKIRNGMA